MIYQKIAEKIIKAVKMRVKPPIRRSPLDKLQSRMYYRKNRSKIRLQRRKYIRKYKNILKHRKLFKRYKPTWFKKKVEPKTKTSPTVKKLKTKKPETSRLFKPTIPTKKSSLIYGV